MATKNFVLAQQTLTDWLGMSQSQIEDFRGMTAEQIENLLRHYNAETGEPRLDRIPERAAAIAAAANS